MASPSTTICPDLTGSRPKRALTNSDLPLPMSPPIPTISPPRPRLREPRHAACCERVGSAIAFTSSPRSSFERDQLWSRASVWSSDSQSAHEVATRIEAGTVWINKHLDMAPHIPYGGAKQSSIGPEFAEEGLAEFTQLQIINGPGASA